MWTNGAWHHQGEADTLETAKTQVKALAKRFDAVKADLRDAPEGAYCGMKALRGRGFCVWSGTGGQMG